MYVTHVHAYYLQKSEKSVGSPETTIVNHHVGCGNQSRILYKKAVLTQPPLFQLPCQDYLCAS